MSTIRVDTITDAAGTSSPSFPNPITTLSINNINIVGAITENVYNLTGTSLDPANGTIQQKTLTASVTLTDAFTTGESMILMINDGTNFTVTWPAITWVNNGGIAPVLSTTLYTVVALWKAGTVLYGSFVGKGT